MGEMPCVYEMNLIEENEQMEQDIVAGRGMDILFCLMNNLDTQDAIAKRIGMPKYSVQLYLQRLVKAGLVREEKVVVRNDEVSRIYRLVSTDIEIIDRLRKNVSTQDKQKNEIVAQYMAMLVRNAVRSAGNNLEKPGRVQAHFMKARECDMKNFINKMDQLFEEYEQLEDVDEVDMYSLFSIMTPYETER